jgi:hypothetical protein
MSHGAERDDDRRRGRTAQAVQQYGEVFRIWSSEPGLAPLESGKPLIRRVRNAGEGFVCGPVQLKRLGWTIAVCRCVGIRICPDATSIRVPRARPFALCSARPLSKGCERKKTGMPWGRSEHGAMTRAWMHARVGLFEN